MATNVVFTKDQIESMVRSKSSRVSFNPCGPKRKIFNKILVDGGFSKYVKCSKCPEYIIKYCTQGMINHETSKHSIHSKENKVQLTIQHYVPCTVSAADKEKVSRAAAICSALDLEPFCFAEKKGHRHYVNTITKVCQSNKGHVQAKDVCPTRKTVVKYVHKISAEVKTKMVVDFSTVDCVHTTCDHWKDKSSRNFFTVTGHFPSLDSGPEVLIESFVMATIETSCKTAEQIKIDYNSVIDSYGISEKIKTVVTDSASSNKSAFKFRDDIKWYPCTAHELNLVLTHAFTFKHSDPDYRDVEDVEKLIESCKELVAYCKRSGLNAHLDISLKQSVETRWDSILESLESIDESFDQLVSVSEWNVNLHQKLFNISRSLMQQIIDLLVPFRIARKKLCQNSLPTFHEVAVIKHSLISVHLKSSNSDMKIIKKMKERLGKFTKLKITVTEDHIIASYLHPGLKSNFVSKLEDKNLVKDAIVRLSNLVKSVNVVTTRAIESDIDVTPAKKSRSDDLFSSCYTASNSLPKQKLTELEEYRFKQVSNNDRDSNPLSYWKEKTSLFPKLSQIALEYMSIPATSVKSEQNFSAAGQLVSDKRTNMKSETVDAVLHIRSNFSYLEKIN